MALTTHDLKPGDVLSYWHDAGCMGMTLGFATVVRVGPKMIRVRGQHGEERWKRPDWFHRKVSDKTATELRDEGTVT